MKLGVYAVVFFIALFCAGRAQASPFCAADVEFMTPWNFDVDAPAPSDSSAHYAYRLKDDGDDVLSGHIVVATDTQTYVVPFDDVRFVDSNNPPSNPDPIGDEYEAPGAFLSLPAPAPIRYAWVSDVTDSAGKTSKCPIFPYKLESLTAAERAQMTSVPPPKGVHVMYRDRLARAGAPIASATCGDPYRETKPDGDGPRYTQFFDPSISGKPIVQGAAAVDPSGRVIATAVLKSSGSQVYDNAAKEEWAIRKFIPALFDCQPAAGIYFFAQEYYYNR
ncbi:MAG TPA: energy transducer TonB [Candidatus Baltobacteraceae bacterium]|nr:energy transducer TonB [Candidatus Baltobacteraceae bacterium]